MALLLAFLALPCGKAHTRDELIGLLWGTRSESQARGSLRHALWTLRKCFEGIEPSPLAVDGDMIVFGAGGVVEVDAAAFEKLAGESTPDALRRAADLYGGDLLAGFGPREPAAEEWLFQERQRLADLGRRTLERLMDYQAGELLLDQATGTAHRLLAMDRLSENAHRCLMRIYMDRGQRGLALRQFEICRDLLRDELGVAPQAETDRLYGSIAHQRPSDGDGAVETTPPLEPQAPPPVAVAAGPAGGAKSRRTPAMAAAAAVIVAIVGFAVYQANFEDYMSQRFARLDEAIMKPPGDEAALAEQQNNVAEMVEQTRAAAEAAQSKAAEIAFWSLIKDSPNPSDHDAYLGKYPQGDFTVLALARLDAIGRDMAAAAAAEAARRQRAAEERALWEAIEASEEAADFRAYLRTYPDGAFNALAWARLDGIESDELAEEEAQAEIEAARRRAAEDAARGEAEARVAEQALWDAIGNSVSASDYEAYLQQYPNGVFSGLARARLVEAVRRAAADAAEAARHAEAQAKLDEARRIAEEAAARNEALTAERALWDAIENSASADDYAAYLQQYQNGVFAALAGARMAELQRQAAAAVAEAARRAEEEAKFEQAEQAAREKVELAALAAAAAEETLPITEQGLLLDMQLKTNIKNFYNRYPLETQRMYGNPLYFRNITDMRVLGITGNRAQIDLLYRVRGKNTKGSSQGHARALVTVEKTGSSFRVLEMKRWDGPYSALSLPPEENFPITEEEILQDAMLKTNIKEFYDRNPIERHSYSGSAY